MCEWWTPKPDYTFDGKTTVVNTDIITGVENTAKLTTFAIAIKFTVLEIPAN